MRKNVEWPTLAAIIGCYILWGSVLWSDGPLWAVIPLLALIVAFHSSLQHEIIHGHPFRDQSLNEAMVYPSLNLAIPFARFRDTHLAHHVNHNLTDPYDDPESNYLCHQGWSALCATRRMVMRFNATLLGRILVGPMVGQACFIYGDLRSNDRRIVLQWMWHGVLMVPFCAVIYASPTPLWAYAIAAYAGLGLLKIRTFAEHQAHDHIGARSVVIEDRGPLAFLFLNNNFHLVHHMHPKVPWYVLPNLYQQQKERYLKRNHGYHFMNYAGLFRRYFVRSKDPIVHPNWQGPTQ